MSRKTKAQRKNYSSTFKERAIRLAQQSDSSTSQVARELGIPEKSLLAWVRQANAEADRGAEVLAANEKEELKSLRRENARLKEEAEILKKAAIYFGNQSR